MRYETLIRNTFEVKSASGAEIQCLCPWHGDRSGHLYANADRGVYLCMSCGEKGHLDRLGVTLPPQTTQGVRDRIAALRTPEKPLRHHPEAWLNQYAFDHPYWTEQRGLPAATIRQFCLGYDPFTNRVTIPLRDTMGRVLGVSRRALDGDTRPRYLDPKGYPKGRYLFGAWLLTNERTVALVEGPMDAIRCWSYGVPAMALMGSRLSHDQRKVLQRLGIAKVVLLMDNDHAGTKATLNAYAILQGSGIRVVSGWYRDYWFGVDDPDSLTKPRLRKMYHAALPMTEWAQVVGA